MSEQQVNKSDFVLFLCSWYPSELDAFNGDFVKRHAQAVATQMKVVVLYAGKDPTMKSKQIELAYQQDKGVHEYIYYYPQQKYLDKVWSQWYYRKVLKQFIPHLLKEHGTPKIVHIHVLWKAAQWVLYLHKRFRWPFVITEHSTEYLPEGADNFQRKERLRKEITRKAFRKSALVMPVSHRLGDAMQALFGKKETWIIPNVVDTNIFYPVSKATPANEVFKLVHISTMGFQKNVDGIIRVVKKLVEAEMKFSLSMIGPATDAITDSLSSTEALKDTIRFYGNIPYETVAEHLRRADGFFLFSRYENLPCVILEALCCGVPVVSTDVGDISTLINESNGKLIASEDEEALYTALCKLIEGKTQYDRQMIAEQAKQRFNYETVGRQYVEAYERVLGKQIILNDFINLTR